MHELPQFIPCESVKSESTKSRVVSSAAFQALGRTRALSSGLIGSFWRAALGQVTASEASRLARTLAPPGTRDSVHGNLTPSAAP
jgi:hypothetical protein